VCARVCVWGGGKETMAPGGRSLKGCAITNGARPLVQLDLLTLLLHVCW